MNSNIYSILTFLFFLIGNTALAQNATIVEKLIPFTTYNYSDPDPVPRITNFYPYYRFDGFTNEPLRKDWKIVVLENPYIKVLVAPEIGGKVLGAIDKSSGEEFIYYNKVMKFRDIAMRGAWTSGGIEFNFGSIGHAPTTASHVNYILRENDDGSVSCIVGAPDITSRTEWRVEIKLEANKSYFETKAIWYNPYELKTSLYNWMTASVDVSDDLEYYFPGTTEIGHGGEASSWPVNKNGVNISHYKNNNFGGPKSYHVLGEFAEHFLCYFRDKDFGLGHWATYDEKPGQKIWLWALSREGEIWADLLTDPGNKQYTEIQTGLLFNQAALESSKSPYKHLFFSPQTEYKFSELWFPVKNIGGMVTANKYGSLNVEKRSGIVKIGFCANQPVSEVLKIKIDGKTAFTRTVNLDATESVIDSFVVNNASNVEVNIGKLLTYNTNDNKDRKLSKKTEINKEFDFNSIDALFSSGLELEKQREYIKAEKSYSQVLHKDSFHLNALSRMAALHYRKMQYKSACEYALKALSIDTYNNEANYYFGLISTILNKKYDALDAFSIASRSTEYKALSYTQIAKIYFVDEEVDKALNYVNKALEYNTNSIETLKLKTLLLEAKGEELKRTEVLDNILVIDPLNFFAKFEKGEDISMLLNYEMPHEICLEQAISYYNLNQTEKAVKALKTCTPTPIIYYWLAYLSDNTEYLKLATSGSVQLVYPSRPETLVALEWAKNKDDSWKTNYYIALLYWSKGCVDEAIPYFDLCKNLPDYFAFYLSRYNVSKDKNNYNGESDLLRAWELDKGQWRTYKELINYYKTEQEFERATDWASKAHGKFTGNYYIAYEYATMLLQSGNYEKCLTILNETEILPNEGAKNGRITYRQALLLKALESIKKENYNRALNDINKAREWPENLGVGKPYDTDERLEDFLASICLEKTGKPKEAHLLQSEVIEACLKSDLLNSNQYLGALLLVNNGETIKATELLENWVKIEDDNLIAHWCYQKLNGNDKEANKILERILEQQNGSLLNPGNKDIGFAIIETFANHGN